MERLRHTLCEVPRAGKYLVMLCADALLVPVALWLAFAIKYDSLGYGLGVSAWLFVGATIASLGIFASLRLYQSVVRYIGLREIAALIAGSVGSAAVVYGLVIGA